MTPAKDLQLTAGTEWIMVHTGAKESQAAFSTQHIIACEHNHRIASEEAFHEHLGEKLPQMIEIPARLTEEPVVFTEVAVIHRLAGDNQIRNKTVAMRNDPTDHPQAERHKRRLREHRSKPI